MLTHLMRVIGLPEAPDHHGSVVVPETNAPIGLYAAFARHGTALWNLTNDMRRAHGSAQWLMMRPLLATGDERAGASLNRLPRVNCFRGWGAEDLPFESKRGNVVATGAPSAPPDPLAAANASTGIWAAQRACQLQCEAQRDCDGFIVRRSLYSRSSKPSVAIEPAMRPATSSAAREATRRARLPFSSVCFLRAKIDLPRCVYDKRFDLFIYAPAATVINDSNAIGRSISGSGSSSGSGTLRYNTQQQLQQQQPQHQQPPPPQQQQQQQHRHMYIL